MDLVFIEGLGAVVSGLIVFCGSAFLLLTLIMGARLAYFITATLTLGFILIMTLVWGFGDVDLNPDNPLGPVGRLPKFDPVGLAENVSEIEFPAATQYPDPPWRPVDEDDPSEITNKTLVNNGATDALEAAIEEGEVTEYDAASEVLADDDSVRFLEQGDDLYGAVVLDPVPVEGAVQEPGAEDLPSLTVVLKFDPGNPLTPARRIAAGIFLLFVLHLVGLSRLERRVQREKEAAEGGSA